MSVPPPSSPSPLPLVRRCRRRWRRRLLRSFSSILPFPSCPPPLSRPPFSPPSPSVLFPTQLACTASFLLSLLHSSCRVSDGRTPRRSRSSLAPQLARPRLPKESTQFNLYERKEGGKPTGSGAESFPHRRQNAKTPTVTRKRTGKRSGFAHELEKPHLFTCGCWRNGRGLSRRTENDGGSSTRGAHVKRQIRPPGKDCQIDTAPPPFDRDRPDAQKMWLA